jgi:hypothetical protein
MAFLIVVMLLAILVAALVLPTFIQALGTLSVDVAVESLPPLSEHALQKHAEALEVHTWLSQNAAPYCKWDCGDGRKRYGCQVGPEKWAFAVIEAGKTVTAFYTNRDYAVGHTRDWPGCTNWNHYAHP